MSRVSKTKNPAARGTYAKNSRALATSRKNTERLTQPMTAPDTHLWGIDLGGTKIEGAVIDSNSGRPLCRRRIDTQAGLGYGHIISRIGELVEDLTAETGLAPRAVGMGTPGATEPSTGRIKNSNPVCLNGMPLESDCAARLGVPVVTANDANCFALAETMRGAAASALPEAGKACVFGIIMGTGVGGGLVVNGRILSGLHGIGGEWGHNFLDAEGGPCYCGRAGCVETLISGPALERHYAKISGRTLKLREIMARTTTDPHAAALQGRLLSLFGRAVAAVINIVDPDAIVIGGGVGNIDALYGPEARAEILKNVFNPELKTLILRPSLGDSAGVFGAAELTRARPAG